MIDSYVQSILGERETVIFITRKHWSLLFFSTPGRNYYCHPDYCGCNPGGDFCSSTL